MKQQLVVSLMLHCNLMTNPVHPSAPLRGGIDPINSWDGSEGGGGGGGEGEALADDEFKVPAYGKDDRCQAQGSSQWNNP